MRVNACAALHAGVGCPAFFPTRVLLFHRAQQVCQEALMSLVVEMLAASSQNGAASSTSASCVDQR
jgi:hypothetical protein